MSVFIYIYIHIPILGRVWDFFLTYSRSSGRILRTPNSHGFKPIQHSEHKAPHNLRPYHKAKNTTETETNFNVHVLLSDSTVVAQRRTNKQWTKTETLWGRQTQLQFHTMFSHLFSFAVWHVTVEFLLVTCQHNGLLKYVINTPWMKLFVYIFWQMLREVANTNVQP